MRALNVQPAGLEGRHRDHNLVIAVYRGESSRPGGVNRKGLVLLGSETLETLGIEPVICLGIAVSDNFVVIDLQNYFLRPTPS